MFERVKVITIGDKGCGKTCFIRSYSEKRFVPSYMPTIGVDYGVISFQANGFDVEVDILDLSGDPDFFEVRNEFYKDCEGVMLFYDISNKESFLNLDGWLHEMQLVINDKKKFKKLHFRVFGTKLDKPREVIYEDCLKWAKERNVVIIENSAKNNLHIKDGFESFIEAIMTRRHNVQEAANGLNFYTREQKETIDKIIQSKTDFEVLSLNASCTIEDVNRSFRKLSMLIHPDKCSANKCEEAFKKLVSTKNKIINLLFNNQ